MLKGFLCFPLHTHRPELFHVKGTSALNTYAVQVPAVAASLNSGDCFVLVLPETVYVWLGKGSNEHEKEIAINIAEK